MSGCLEHTGVVTQLIREARENKGNLSVLWLDLVNAFGSIPHKLVQLTLEKHHVPSRCRDLIADYYTNFRMRVSSGATTSLAQGGDRYHHRMYHLCDIVLPSHEHAH